MNRPQPCAVVFAKDVDRLARFYSAVAEMTMAFQDDLHTVLDQLGFQLVIHGIPSEISEQIEIQVPPDVRSEVPLKLCLPVSSIQHARTLAAELGGHVGSQADEWAARGFRACDGFDPEGNVFQVRESADR